MFPAPTEFERRIEVEPAFDKRDADPKKNYGIGSTVAHFSVIGPKGAVRVTIDTGWYLPQNRPDVDRSDAKFYAEHGRTLHGPSGRMVSYHCATPRSTTASEPGPCDLLPGGQCWGDGSYLDADTVMETLIAEGLDGLWRDLEARYRSYFNGDENVPAPD